MSYSTTAHVFYGVVFTQLNPPRTGDGEVLTSEDLENLEGLDCRGVGSLMGPSEGIWEALLIPESLLSLDAERGEYPKDPAHRLEVQSGWNRRLEDGLAKLGITNAPPLCWHFAWETG